MDDSSVKGKIESRQPASSPSIGPIGAADYERSPEVEATISKIRDQIRAEKSVQDPAQPVATDYHFDEVLFFGSSGKGQRHLGPGWHGAEPLFTWTEDLHAFLHLSLPPTGGDLTLEFKATGYINSKLFYQDVLLEVNGILCGRLQMGREYGFSLIIPKSIVAISREFVICFTCLTRASPSQYKRNSDPRTLGMALHSLVIHESVSHPRPKSLDPRP